MKDDLSFKNLYIDNHVEEQFNMHDCYVLRLNFAFKTDYGDIQLNFNKNLIRSMKRFCKTYQFTSNEIEIDEIDPIATLNNIGMFMENKKFIVTIDEFDRITNEMITSNPEAYECLITRNIDMIPLKSILPMKSFMVELKQLSAHFRFELFKTYIFGVTPLAISDISDYNISIDLSFNPSFSELCCFDKTEVENAIILTQILSDSEYNTVKNIINIQFVQSIKSFFNPTVVLEFLLKLATDSDFKERVLTNKLRRNELFSSNVRAGRSAIDVILASKHSESIIFNLLYNGIETISNIRNIIYLPEICPINNIDRTNREAIISYLYYNGILSIVSFNNSQVQLGVPNNSMYNELSSKLGYYIKNYENFYLSFKNTGYESDLQNFIEKLFEPSMKVMDNSYSKYGMVSCFISAISVLDESNDIETQTPTFDENSADFTTQHKIMIEYVTKKKYIVVDNQIIYLGFMDAVWNIGNERQIFKFEIIKPNAIIWNQSLLENIYNKVPYWSRENFQKLFNRLYELTDEELLSLRIDSKISRTGKNYVHEIVLDAKLQLEEYAKGQRILFPNIGLTGYIVICVANRYIVKKYDF